MVEHTSEAPSAQGKSPTVSRVEMTQLVLPGDTNALGTAFGGKIVQWIDIAAAVAARRHAGGVSVTASIDSLQFTKPVQLGDVVVLYACINRTWHSSLEAGVRVVCEPAKTGQHFHAARAYLTFVALDDAGKPRKIPPVLPETPDETRRFEQAQARREHRLIARKTWLSAEDPVGR